MIVSLLLAALASAAAAAEVAHTVRPTELKAKPFTDAATVESLGEASKVDVLARQASWMQVKTDKKNTGWVKLLSLRFDAINGKPSGVNENLNVVFNLAKTGSGGSTATTGVKGISEEQLKNPQPNPAALAQVNEMTVSPSEMEQFTLRGNLKPQKVAYVVEGGRK
ncbi:hypothetical protein [Zemynaea arenosa]|nr:hypothetical protein [Massilia arenosa]